MRAQTKVREHYVTVRLTHRQLRALAEATFGSHVTGRAIDEAHEIVCHAAKAIYDGFRGEITRSGQRILLHDWSDVSVDGPGPLDPESVTVCARCGVNRYGAPGRHCTPTNENGSAKEATP